MTSMSHDKLMQAQSICGSEADLSATWDFGSGYNCEEGHKEQYRVSLLHMAFIWRATLMPSVHALRKVIVWYCACTLLHIPTE